MFDLADSLRGYHYQNVLQRKNRDLQLLFWCFFQVIEMAEIEGLEPKLATTFFKKKVFPNVQKYQVELSNFEPDSAPSDEPLIIDLLVKCITTFKIPIQEVRLQV